MDPWIHGTCTVACAYTSTHPISRNANSDRQPKEVKRSWGAIAPSICIIILMFNAFILLTSEMRPMRIILRDGVTKIVNPGVCFAIIPIRFCWLALVSDGRSGTYAISMAWATATTSSLANHEMRVRPRLLSAWPKWNSNEWK